VQSTGVGVPRAQQERRPGAAVYAEAARCLRGVAGGGAQLLDQAALEGLDLGAQVGRGGRQDSEVVELLGTDRAAVAQRDETGDRVLELADIVGLRAGDEALHEGGGEADGVEAELGGVATGEAAREGRYVVDSSRSRPCHSRLRAGSTARSRSYHASGGLPGPVNHRASGFQDALSDSRRRVVSSQQHSPLLSENSQDHSPPGPASFSPSFPLAGAEFLTTIPPLGG
jgi:hypothetical protein